MGEFILIIFYFLCLISFDCLFGFLIFLLYRYLDLKYFSQFEITQLKEEIQYLRNENKKVNGSSSDFWKEG